MKKIILVLFFFYFLTLFQTSFLVHFFSCLPNLIFLIVFLVNFFEGKENNFGLFCSFTGGFFLDVFSENYIGYHILFLLLFSLFIKGFIKSYVEPKFW